MLGITNEIINKQIKAIKTCQCQGNISSQRRHTSCSVHQRMLGITNEGIHEQIKAIKT
jgi:biotin operon repressor